MIPSLSASPSVAIPKSYFLSTTISLSLFKVSAEGEGSFPPNKGSCLSFITSMEHLAEINTV